MGEKKFRAGRGELEPLEINPKGKVGRPPFDHNCHIFFHKWEGSKLDVPSKHRF